MSAGVERAAHSCPPLDSPGVDEPLPAAELVGSRPPPAHLNKRCQGAGESRYPCLDAGQGGAVSGWRLRCGNRAHGHRGCDQESRRQLRVHAGRGPVGCACPQRGVLRSGLDMHTNTSRLCQCTEPTRFEEYLENTRQYPFPQADRAPCGRRLELPSCSREVRASSTRRRR